MDGPEPRARRDPVTAGRRLVDGAYQRADRILDEGQHRAFRVLWLFLPAIRVARNPRLEQVMASRFLSDAGQQALAYGALIAVVRGGGSTVDAALVGVAALVPPALFGLYGGAVADALPKRVALAAVYNLQAILCFLVPAVAGTDLIAIMLLVFAVNALGQVSGPTESSVVPYVVSSRELASAASLLSLASNLGTAFGTALLAPVVVRAYGTDAVFAVAGVLLALAASRVFDLPTTHHGRKVEWLRPGINARATIEWLVRERAVATMMLVAVLAGTANIVLQVLAPRFVKEALGVDPADAVYVFAPSALGLGLALFAAPGLIRRFGERIVALTGFAVLAAALALLGLDVRIAPVADAINPMRALDLLGIELSSKVRTAGLFGAVVGFGLSLTTTSVQTYLNRRVPLAYQGRAFALQSVLKNATAIVPLLTLGAAASAFGVEAVLVVSPFVLLVLAAGLLQVSVLFGGQSPLRQLDVLQSFWEEPGIEVSAMPGEVAPSHDAESDDNQQHGAAER